MKRREEIDRGVASELKKRGMAGELDDPLLMQTVGGSKHVGSYGGAGHNGGKNLGFSSSKDGDYSTLGLGGMGEDDESQTIRNIDSSKKKDIGMTGIEDSELTHNIVGIGSNEKKKEPVRATKELIMKKDKKDKKNKDKKKKKDKKKDGSDSD